MPKEWYDPTLDDELVQCLTEARWAQQPVRNRWARKRSTPVGLFECLIYPLVDAPGIVLLVFMPPILWILSLPIFDIIAVIEPFTKGNWALGLLVAPIFIPLLTSFSLVLGYALLFLGSIVVSSALGETDHPNWPEWDTHEISEGLGRWIWAAIFGVVVGGFPTVLYWMHAGQIDWFDRIIFIELIVLGAGYAQLTLMASLLHDSILAANPITVIVAAFRFGWDFVQPCLFCGIALLTAAATFLYVVFHMPKLEYALIGLWGFWLLVLYEAMVVGRMIGLTYYRHADAMAWFHDLPRWGIPGRRRGRIYSNS
jgi:hypothetical protein